MRAVLTGRARLAALVSVLACAVVAFVVAPVAGAEVTHPKIGAITEANGKPLVQPWGLTFDNTGKLFVGEQGNGVVDVFNPSNGFETEISVGGLNTRQVTVDYANGDVYVAESGAESVFVYKPVLGGYELVQKVQLEGFLYVAFDNSSGVDKGDLYILGANGHKVWVAKTNSEGLLGEGHTEERSFFNEEEEAVEGLPTLAPPTGFGNFEGTGENGKGALAVNNTNGKLYITEPARKFIAVYGPEGAYQTKIEGTLTKAKSFEPFSVAVEESTGNLYIYDHAHHVIDELNSAGSKVESEITEGVTGETISVAVQNAPVGTKNEIYTSDDTEGAARINIYEGTPTPKFPLTVKVTGTGSGKVTGGGISCPGTCSANEAESEVVTLTETPAAGSSFAGWSGGGCSGVGATCTVTINAAVEVTAEFALGAPVNTGLPVISGTEKEGHTLSTTNGTWTGSPSGYTYQWEDCNTLGEACSSIVGANTSSYTLTKADVGDTVRVIVTAKNAGGSSSPAASLPTGVIAALAGEASVSSNVYGEVEQAVTLGSTCSNVNLGPFLPLATNASYEKTCTLTATSTLAESALTAEDSSATNKGHLVNGTYFLTDPLETKATETEGVSTGGGTFAALTSPVTLLSYPTPVSANAVTVAFKQTIPGHEGLRTGTYAKTITITLAAKTP